jgi:hypothetical protein
VARDYSLQLVTFHQETDVHRERVNQLGNFVEELRVVGVEGRAGEFPGENRQAFDHC